MTAPPSEPAWLDELVTETVPLPGGDLELLQPRESAELPDECQVEWAPMVPYWSVLWRSGLALARELSSRPLDGLSVVELGCGLGVPSLVARRAGASVLATDAWPEALELLAENAGRNGLEIETAEVDWATPDKLVARGPFDLVLAADVLYERQSVAKLLGLLPRLAPEAIVADPGRPAADAFLAEARRRWRIETHTRGVVRIHALAFG